MEERSPPPEVESWAATSEPAAMMRTCENFIVRFRWFSSDWLSE